jgi:hypothetical protein
VNQKIEKKKGNEFLKILIFENRVFKKINELLKKIMNELPQIDEKTLAQFWQDSFSKD